MTATVTQSTESTMTSTERTTGSSPERPALRPTKQRLAVIAALEEVEEFRSAQAIHEELNQRGEKIGLATVYRALQALVEADQVDVLRGEDGEAVYRLCSATHHHHLVCRVCGRTEEIEGPEVEAWAARVAGEHGFTSVTHTLEIFGLCTDCAA